MYKLCILFSSLFFITSNTETITEPVKVLETITQKKNVIHDGENLQYIASYNASGFMSDIAEVNMKTKKVKTSKSEFYHLKCTASTYTKWDWYFRVRDIYESYITTSSHKPLLYNRKIEESTYRKQVKYKFKRKEKKANVTIIKKDGRERKSTAPITNNTLDIVSAIYKLRTYDFANFSTGKVMTQNILFDAKQHNVPFKYVGKETISNDALGSIECYKISIHFNGGALKKASGFLYLSADEKQVPVKIAASLPFGEVQIRLKSIQ